MGIQSHLRYLDPNQYVILPIQTENSQGPHQTNAQHAPQPQAAGIKLDKDTQTETSKDMKTDEVGPRHNCLTSPPTTNIRTSNPDSGTTSTTKTTTSTTETTTKGNGTLSKNGVDKQPTKRPRTQRTTTYPRSKQPFTENQPLNYDHLSRYTSNSEDDDANVPPMLSSTLRRTTNKLFLVAILFLAITVTPAATVKIDGTLLCRPRISPDNLNRFIKSLSESLNLILDTEIGHPDKIMKTGGKSIIIVKPNQGDNADDLDIKCDQLGLLYNPNSISEFDVLCENIRPQVPYTTSSLRGNRKLILMKVVEINGEIKPFSL